MRSSPFSSGVFRLLILSAGVLGVSMFHEGFLLFMSIFGIVYSSYFLGKDSRW